MSQNVQANSTYCLTNAQGGTCVDLSGGDNVSIIGYGYHGGANQAWTFLSTGGDRTFQLKSGSGKYLSVNGDPQDGAKVVASDSPYTWRVEDEQGGVRLLPETNPNYSLDLSDHGNSTPGTPVQLWSRWDGQNQIWKVQRTQ